MNKDLDMSDILLGTPPPKGGGLLTRIKTMNMTLRKFVCHRRPDRTLKFKSTYFPVCARCTGIYIGALLIFLLDYLDYFVSLTYSLNLLFISLVLMLPTAVDGTTQLLKWRESRNWIRVVTGLLCGIGYGIILIYL